ncbi:ABC1 kinase family protein [Novipirellula sp. SH528]|uniref:ABC1 kinase family protein n=1 Tax=Novipirellula sp. SH528 TaxID=3454466 RepID=UPI003F9FCD8E
MIPLQTKYLRRYKDIALLLHKYGQGDLLKTTGIDLESEEYDNDVRSDSATPDDLASDLERLGPAFIKLGQLLSTRGDFLPEPYLEALSRLQDDNKPVPWEDVRELLASEYQTDPNKIFAEIEECPAATASLGQVHHATLRDGREVIVKVQRPDLQPDLDDDLRALEELAALLHSTTEFGEKYQLVNLVATLKKSILSELDYRREAGNAKRLKESLADYHSIYVPEPVLDLCRKRVLVMQRVSGVKITDVSPVVLLELDGRQLADEIFSAYLHQILVDGHFHADPHPGNLWLTQERRIALLDFGLVVHVAPAMQRDLLKLLLAVGNGDSKTAAQFAHLTGEKTSRYDRDRLQRQIAEVFSDGHGASMDELNAGRMIMKIQGAACDAGVILPNEVTMLGKTLMNLDKVVKLLDPEFNPTQAIRDHANQIVGQHGSQRLSLSDAYQAIIESAELMQNLPARMNEISRRVAESDFRVKVDSLDEDKIITGMQKIANRITAGLIIAALILAASRMMSMEAGLTVFGYPAIASLFLFISIMLGGMLLWQILVHDQCKNS